MNAGATEHPLFRAFLQDGAKTTMRHGMAFMDCPFCGHTAKEREVGKLAIYVDGGFFCCVCQEKGSLSRLWDHLGKGERPRDYPVRIDQKPKKPPLWKNQPQYWLDRYCGHFDRLAQWQAYKPLSIETIAKHHLGVGILPDFSSACTHRRLIMPIRDRNGSIVGFRGRSVGCDCPKWLSASGTGAHLANQHLLSQECNVVVCENAIDGLLLNQLQPSWIGVASTAGAGCWHDEWTQMIAVCKPKRVIVWYDNDLAGSPSPSMEKRMKEEWRQTMHQRIKEGKIKTMPHEPVPHGPVVADRLRKAGLSVQLHQWTATDPCHYDLGGYLKQRYFR